MVENFSTKRLLKNSSSKETIYNWSNIVVSACLFLIYSIILAFVGVFYIEFVLMGLLFILILNKSLNPIIFFFRTFFQENFDFLRFIIVISWAIWFLMVIFFAPYPAFSGRDEGSYANAAVYLAKFHSLNFHLPILEHFNAVGAAHQSLNFPGFVIKNGQLSSQFSPAYFVWLAPFYAISNTVNSFPFANGILILGGGIGFYLLVRLFASRWVATAGLFALMFNFLFIWFPRFTFSENLAFFLFSNLVYFLYLFRQTNITSYLYPVIAILAVFPLARPEGWWLMAATVFLVAYWHKKELISISKEKIKILAPMAFFGLLFSSLAIVSQFPIYKRLIRDWLKWPSTSNNYSEVMQGNVSVFNIQEIIGATLPSYEKFFYFLRVEWNYGILFFGMVSTVAVLLYFFYRGENKFSKKILNLVGIAAFLSFPFFGAFFSPQISSDHPWMLRRFFFVVLPCGVLASLIIILAWARRFSLKKSPVAIPFILAVLLIPSVYASSYFLIFRTDTERREVLAKIAATYDQGDYLFLSREASGDGWHMWSEPLSSVYSKNSTYVYSPQNVIDNKQLILERFNQGRKSYIILPENAYDFEHELSKTYDLILDKEFTFNNIQYSVQRNRLNSGFPPLEKQDYTTKVYLLIPR